MRDKTNLLLYLPPLRERTTRTRLLAWSYEDAVMGGRDGVIGGKPQSKLLVRYEELWDAGSYEAFEDALDRLRAVSGAVHTSFCSKYVGRGWREQPRASGELVLLTELMPRNIFVPMDIAQAAGYLPAESKPYDRMVARKRRAAA